jgi:hypothetical protein
VTEARQGSLNTEDMYGEYNKLKFVFSSLISKVNTALPVKIVKVYNNGGVTPVGVVDVEPLIQQVDGQGNSVEIGTLYNLPYTRVQGGANAVIIDPVVGDIGIAVFSSRDISAVKKNKKKSIPPSARKFDLADGMYFGGILNAAPTQYIQFDSTGITIKSPNEVKITCDKATVTATTSAAVTAPAINLGSSGGSLKKLINDTFQSLFNNHTHTCSSPGSPCSPTSTTISSSHITSVVKAN